MNINDFTTKLKQQMHEIEKFAQGANIKDIVGIEAVNHFKNSFKNEGFTDEILNPWKDVKRRDENSKWFGHSGQTSKFSKARTKAKILKGETDELKEAITFKYIERGVRVSNDKEYAAVHQFGLPAKIYGKKTFTMTARPFIGKSKVLMKNINEKIIKEFTEILKK